MFALEEDGHGQVDDCLTNHYHANKSKFGENNCTCNFLTNNRDAIVKKSTVT